MRFTDWRLIEFMNGKKELIKLFENPGAEYRGKPFWSWNGELEKDELIRQVHVMKEMGFGGFFMHSRAGLMTEYLGDEWFELINEVADESVKLGLEAWLYDEDRWPSGSAGGKVTVDPQYRMKSIVMYCEDKEKFAGENELPGSADDEIIAIFAANIDGVAVYEYEQCADKETLAKAAEKDCYNKIIVFRVVKQEPNSVYNGTTYIDTMSYKAVNKFLELTHEEYQKRCGERMGTSIKGIFTDEPHRGHMLDDYAVNDGVATCSSAYTDDIFEEFKKRYNYDLKPILPELYFRKDGKKIHKVKIDYIDLCNILFLERFAKNVNDWCNDHNIIFTGHVLHEDSLTNQTVPNGSLMRFYQYMGYPGIDLLTEHNRCYWVAKQISSASRQLGQKWLLSELYGCTGWQFDFSAHKAVGDWQALFGINVRCPHLSWYTMEGEAKRDYPASILHQSSYYKDYNYVESYFARFGVVMSQGRPLCDLLVINTIESDWALAYAGWAQWLWPTNDDSRALEQHYANLFHILIDNHIDFDYGEECMMNQMYSVTNENGEALLHIGQASYRTVLVSGALTLRPTTVKILKEFMDIGGKVVFSEDIPVYVDGIESDDAVKLSQHKNALVVPFESGAITAAVKKDTAYDICITGEGSEKLLSQVRYDDDTQQMYIAIINTDRENKISDLKVTVKKADGTFAAGSKLYAEEWELVSGKRYKKALAEENGAASISFDIEATGDKIFVLTAEEDASLEEKSVPVTVSETKIAADSEFEYELDEKNVCVLDFAKWKFNGSEWNPAEEVLRVDGKIRDLSKLERRSGGMLQPWYAKKYCDDACGELELEYEFFVDEVPEGEVFAAAERPEFCRYFINGIALENKNPSDFWIDICFKKMYIPEGAIKKGRNTVTMKTLFKRTTNVESVYLVGNFGVRIEGSKKTLVNMPAKLGISKNLCEYNLPFYTGCVTYKISNKEFACKDTDGNIVIEINGYCGSLAKVSPSGGKEQAVIAWAPYEADITEWVKSGSDIDVTLVCSRRNVFGPLHQLPVRTGEYGPGNFTTGGANWTDDYALIDSTVYGITIKKQK